MTPVWNMDWLYPSNHHQHPIFGKFQSDWNPACSRLKNRKTFSTVQAAIEASIFKYNIRSVINFD